MSCKLIDTITRVPYAWAVLTKLVIVLLWNVFQPASGAGTM